MARPIPLMNHGLTNRALPHLPPVNPLITNSSTTSSTTSTPMTNFPTCESCCAPIRARHTLCQFHTAIQRGCPGGIGDDVTPTIRRLEGGKDDHDNDNENKGNDTDLEAQRSEQKRKRVQFVSADTTMPALETPGPDVSSDLIDESPAKRQRLHQHTESASTSMNILLAIPVPSPAPTAIGDEATTRATTEKGLTLMDVAALAAAAKTRHSTLPTLPTLPLTVASNFSCLRIVLRTRKLGGRFSSFMTMLPKTVRSKAANP